MSDSGSGNPHVPLSPSAGDPENIFVPQSSALIVIAVIALGYKNMFKLRGGEEMYKCLACGYEYNPEVGDPDNGIAPGTAFEDLPDTWVCPLCGVGKDMFEEE